MGSGPFVNSLNFGPLYCIVVGLFDLDWTVRSVGETVTPRTRSFRGTGITCRSMPGFLRSFEAIDSCVGLYEYP